MRIKTLLSLSHTFVIGVFIIAFLTIFFYLTGSSGPLPGPESDRALTDSIRTHRSGGKPVERALTDIGYQDIRSLDLYDRDGRHHRLFGPEDGPPPPPTYLSEMFGSTEQVVTRAAEGDISLWISLDLDGPKSHVARLGTVRSVERFFVAVRNNLITACLIAFSTALLVALVLSRALAEPIRRLASLVDRFGREGFELRAKVKGTAEVEELSESFNRMAAYIESNTNELRAQKEQAEKTEESRRQFLSDVSHNLRTPLTAILGWTDALIDGVAEDEHLYRLRIRREVLHVTKIVQRLLELSRWERTGPLLKKEVIPLGELLLEVAENLQDAAEQARVTLSLEGVTPDIAIYADRQKVRDVFQILLENVVEHAGEDVHATVALEQESGRIKVRVEDDGKGLPSTFWDNTDLDRGSSDEGRARLGLAIASRLIEVHGGELGLQSRPSGGTVATFEFEAAPLDDDINGSDRSHRVATS